MDYFSLNAFISGNILLNSLKGGGCAILLLVSGVAGVFSYMRLLRVYGVDS